MNLRTLLVIGIGFFILLQVFAWLLLLVPAFDIGAQPFLSGVNPGVLTVIGALLSVLVLALIGWGVWQYLAQYRRRQCRSENCLDDILVTSREGLLLLDRQLAMASPWSPALANIFAVDHIGDHGFPALMRELLPRKEANSTQGFLQSLFNPELDETHLLALNPLAAIQLVVPDNSKDNAGELKHKMLSFNFKRVWSENTIEHVVVAVSDISELHELQQRLNTATTQADNRQRLLNAVYNANIISLGKFIDQSYGYFSHINQALSQPVSNKLQCAERLNQARDCVGQLAGQVNNLLLVELHEALQDLDKELSSLHGCDELRDQDLFPLRQKLTWIIDYTAQVNAIFQSLSRRTVTHDAETDVADANEPPVNQADTSQNSLSSRPRSAWQHLYQLALDLSLRNDKQVELVVSGLDETPMSGPLREAINTVCIQFISNSIVHGIEPPWERELMQKKALGRIDIHLATVGEDNLELTIEDNGAGFDYARIRDHALRSGRWQAADIEHWDNKKLLSLIFLPGFSTVDAVTEDAGSGIGMDVVMQKIKQLDGKIKLSSRKNEYSRFVISLPLTGVARQPKPSTNGVAA